MKSKTNKILSTILLCTILAGCSNVTVSHEILEEPSSCPISTLRTGTQRQGIRGYGNSFECTKTGSYFMTEINGDRWLLYSEQGSDTIIKLCGRPDCNHTDRDCNAYFGSSISICYYNGFLYTFDINSGDIIRVNLDGTERISVYNISSFERANGYIGRYDQKIMNGMLLVEEIMLDDNGNKVRESCYYKLDGSMKEPKTDIYSAFLLLSDGEKLVGVVDDDYDIDTEDKLYVFGTWEPEYGVVSEFFKSKDWTNHYGGYIGTNAEYYFEDGIIVENSYTEGKRELIDTGLKGSYQLVCFPDCMVVYDCITPEEDKQGVTKKETTMHFYSWDYKDLGNVKINYPFEETLLATGLICGESPEQIFLTDSYFYIPRYYINKSDFGTGNIEIHPLNVPEDLIVVFDED